MMNIAFKSVLAPYIQGLLDQKRALGFKYDKRKNAVSFQKLIDEQPSLLRPTSMQLRIRIAVFV